MDATANLRNVTARLFIWAGALSISGSPVIEFNGQGSHRGRVASSGPFIRWTVEPLPGQGSGRWNSADTATREAVLLIADLFWPVSTADAYQIDQSASEIRDSLTLLSLSILDYASDPAAPPVADSRLRVIEPPAMRRLQTEAGLERRRVSGVIGWISRHTI